MGNCTSSCLRPTKYRVYVLDAFEVPLCETAKQFRLMTVKDVKTKIFEKTKDERYNPDDPNWHLHFEGKECKDDSLLSEIGIKPGEHFSVGKIIVQVDVNRSMEEIGNFEVDEDFY